MSPSRKTAPVFAPPTRRRFSPLVAIWRSPCCIALACPRFPPPDVPFPLIPSRLLPFSVPPQASTNSQTPLLVPEHLAVLSLCCYLPFLPLFFLKEAFVSFLPACCSLVAHLVGEW